MSRAGRQQTVRLKLLALVLALALTWYTVNPAPGPAVSLARPPLRPDRKGDPDDLEWPEVIDV